MNPLDLPAGAELDRLVAERMGMTQHGTHWMTREGHVLFGGFRPSTDIAHAWMALAAAAPLVPVVYQLQAVGWCCLLVPDNVNINAGAIDVDTLGNEGCGIGPTAPLAICRALLSLPSQERA